MVPDSIQIPDGHQDFFHPLVNQVLQWRVESANCNGIFDNQSLASGCFSIAGILYISPSKISATKSKSPT